MLVPPLSKTGLGALGSGGASHNPGYMQVHPLPLDPRALQAEGQ